MNDSYIAAQNNSVIRRAVDRRGLVNFGAAVTAGVLFTLALLLHTFVRTRMTEQGYRLSRLSAEYRELTREHEALQVRSAELRSPQRIEQLARTRLSMGPAPLERTVVIPREPTAAARPKALLGTVTAGASP